MSTAPSTLIDNWAAYWAGVGNEEYLTARALLDLSYDVRTEVARHLSYVPEETEVEGDEVMVTGGYWRLDWEAFAASLDATDDTRPLFSSTGQRLARLVAALTADAPFDVCALTRMGSWETDVWRILVNWGTGGNNREYPGRATVVAR